MKQNNLMAMVFMAVLLVSGCGGKSAELDELSVYFAMGEDFSPALSIAGWDDDSPDQNLAGDVSYYEAEFFRDGVSVLGPLHPELINTDAQIYVVRTDQLPPGEYTVVWRLLYAGVYDGDDVVLAETSADFTMVADAVTLDMSVNAWQSNYDADEDGLSNLHEVLIGTALDDPDTDDDGIVDGSDDEPLVAAVSEEPSPQISEDASGVSVIKDTDFDDDGITDENDNCPFVANDLQDDLDGDGFGSACDYDRDGDGVRDAEDNCPATVSAASLTENQAVQTDADSDGFGLPCDCDDGSAMIYPGGDDVPDRTGVDSDCDGIDGVLSGAVLLVSSMDGLPATIDTSVVTDDFSRALAMAANLGRDVYASLGTYTVPGAVIPQGVSFYGGYSADFGVREVTPDAPATTILISSALDSGAGLEVASPDDPVVISGVSVAAKENWGGDVLVAVAGGNTYVEGVRFTGDAFAAVEILLQAQDGGITLDSADFRGMATSSSTGLELRDADALLTNSIFAMGSAVNTTAINITGGSFSAAHNTIDGGRHPFGGAYGAVVGGAEAEFINNIFITMSFERQSSVRCTGVSGATSVFLNNNLFLRFSTDTSSGEGSGYSFAAYESCAGLSHLKDTASLSDENLAELSASGNQVWSETDIAVKDSGLASITDDNYRPVSASPVIGAGDDMGLNLAPWDRLDVARSAPTDIGAYAWNEADNASDNEMRLP